MQHSLVVHLHDPQGRSKADRKKRYGRTDVFYSNYCSESGKGTPECHINIDGTDPAIKPYITTRRGKNGFTNYQVNFSKIIKHFYCKGSEPASKKTNCHLITPKAWKKNRSNSTYISSVIFHTGATQADEVVNVRNINVRGVPKSPPVKQEKPQQISREGEESEGEESEISVASAFREER